MSRSGKVPLSSPYDKNHSYCNTHSINIKIKSVLTRYGVIMKVQNHR